MPDEPAPIDAHALVHGFPPCVPVRPWTTVKVATLPELVALRDLSTREVPRRASGLGSRTCRSRRRRGSCRPSCGCRCSSCGRSGRVRPAGRRVRRGVRRLHRGRRAGLPRAARGPAASTGPRPPGADHRHLGGLADVPRRRPLAVGDPQGAGATCRCATAGSGRPPDHVQRGGRGPAGRLRGVHLGAGRGAGAHAVRDEHRPAVADRRGGHAVRRQRPGPAVPRRLEVRPARPAGVPARTATRSCPCEPATSACASACNARSSDAPPAVRRWQTVHGACGRRATYAFCQRPIRLPSGSVK